MLKRIIKHATKQVGKIETILDGRYRVWDNREQDDDLFLHIGLVEKEIFREFIYLLNKKKNFQSSHRNIGSLMYFMGMHNLRSVFILNIVEDQMDLFKDKFSPRTAFGFFCGALNLSSQKHFIHFSKQEYINKLDDIDNEYLLQEITEICKAITKNENLTKEEKMEIWIEVHQNLINKNIEKLKKDFDTCYNILYSMQDLGLQDNDLFIQITEIILKNDDCLIFDNIVKLHQIFKKISKETNNFKGQMNDYQKYLNKIEKVIKNEEDYIWRYDLDKSQLRSYRELYNNRENERYKNQIARFIPEGVLNLNDMKEFKRDVIDNPKIMGFDYSNLKQYIEAPWGDDEEIDQLMPDEEETDEVINDLESDVIIDDQGNIKRLEQLTIQRIINKENHQNEENFNSFIKNVKITYFQFQNKKNKNIKKKIDKRIRKLIIQIIKIE